MIGITVTYRLHKCFSSLASARYLSSFLQSFPFCDPGKRPNPLFYEFFLFIDFEYIPWSDQINERIFGFDSPK